MNQIEQFLENLSPREKILIYLTSILLAVLLSFHFYHSYLKSFFNHEIFIQSDEVNKITMTNQDLNRQIKQYEQHYTSFNFFAEKLTDRTILNYEIPAIWFQSLGGLFVILFAPFSAFIWTICAKNNKEISSIVKFALGLLCATLAFLIMTLASNHAIDLNGNANTLRENLENSSQIILVSPWWLVSSFLLTVLGELCLSPVGLSIMTKIAPNLIKSQVMGLWFVASALGNALAGFIGGKASEENIAYLPNLFYQCMWILLGAVIILLILKKPINKILKN